MRMRKRHNLDSRVEKCAELLTREPEKLRGNWRREFGHEGKLFLELGCGKGRFTVDTAAGNPDVLLIAVEKVPDAMIIAMERAKERGLENVRFIEGDAAKLKEMFANGEIDRIYINFCDPWPKSRDAKFRLTAPSFLRIYHDLLSAGGEIHFKTDNTALFDWSIEQFTAEGWGLREVTHDLHADGVHGVLTDYEAKFLESGLKINRLVAVNTINTKGTDAGTPPRMRNASLSDARGFAQSAAANAGEGEK